MRIVLAMAAATLLAIALLATVPPKAGCCDQPLYNETSEPVPQGLSWYFILVFGDNRPEDTGSAKFPQAFLEIIGDAVKLQPYAVVGTGDHVGEGREYQYKALWRNLSKLSNVLLVPGNHDLLISGADRRWEAYVGPRYWVWEQIPGWSIIGVDTYDRSLPRFKQEAEKVFQESRGPYRILVTHYPLEPDLGYNIDKAPSGSTKERLLSRMIASYNVSLVFQGHWHGYAEKMSNGTLYVVTGGAGAPFYNVRTARTDADYYRTFLAHYILVILRPDGSYTLLPVYIGKGGIGAERINASSVRIWQTRYLLNGTQASLPFRISLERDGINITVQMIVPHGSNVTVTLVRARPPEIMVTGGASMVEAYYTSNGTRISLTSSGDVYMAMKSGGHDATVAGWGSEEGHEGSPEGSPGTSRGGSGRNLLMRWESLLALVVILVVVVARRLS